MRFLRTSQGPIPPLLKLWPIAREEREACSIFSARGPRPATLKAAMRAEESASRHPMSPLPGRADQLRGEQRVRHAPCSGARDKVARDLPATPVAEARPHYGQAAQVQAGWVRGGPNLALPQAGPRSSQPPSATHGLREAPTRGPGCGSTSMLGPRSIGETPEERARHTHRPDDSKLLRCNGGGFLPEG